MKYGMNSLLFEERFTNKAAEKFPRFAEIGFDGIEIALQEKGDIGTSFINDKLAENKLVCSSLCSLMGPGRDLRGRDADIIGAKSYLKDLVDAAVKLGTDTIVGPHYSVVGLTGLKSSEERDADWKKVVAGLREIGEYAGEKGVNLALEPLNRFETDFLNICSDAVRLCDDVGLDNIKIHLDTFHMNIEEKDSAAAIRLAGDRLFMLHASENDRGAPGTGQVSWDTVAEAIKDIGYNRWIVMESFTPEVEIIAKAASIWRQTEVDGWTLASKGLDFVKSIFGR
ncbi:MAG: sugar phosphate isomerase/epimerase [Spirochaetes bacterium]|nr:MAG: sugar phosphate isomerase/epimerase [Spirochaetota bacterium]